MTGPFLTTKSIWPRHCLQGNIQSRQSTTVEICQSHHHSPITVFIALAERTSYKLVILVAKEFSRYSLILYLFYFVILFSRDIYFPSEYCSGAFSISHVILQYELAQDETKSIWAKTMRYCINGLLYRNLWVTGKLDFKEQGALLQRS